MQYEKDDFQHQINDVIHFQGNMDTPIVLINGAKCETPCFPRSGRKAKSSSNNPKIDVTMMAARNANQIEPPITGYKYTNKSTKHKDFTMSHIDNT